MEDYSSNSHKSKNEDSKKTGKAVVKAAGVKKKSELQRFVNLFIAEDVSNIKSYILMDVLIPTAKDALSNIVDTILYGSGYRHSRSNSADSRYRDYNKMSNHRNSNTPKTKNVYNYDDPIFRTKDEASLVLEALDEIIETNGVVSVMDLFIASDRSCDYTYDNYGWTDIRNATLVRYPEGWIIKLPKPMPLTR